MTEWRKEAELKMKLGPNFKHLGGHRYLKMWHDPIANEDREAIVIIMPVDKEYTLG